MKELNKGDNSALSTLQSTGVHCNVNTPPPFCACNVDDWSADRIETAAADLAAVPEARRWPPCARGKGKSKGLPKGAGKVAFRSNDKGSKRKATSDPYGGKKVCAL